MDSLSSQNIPSAFSGADQFIELPNLTPPVGSTNVGIGQPDFLVNVSDSLNVGVSCMSSSIICEATRDTISNCPSGIFFKRSSFRLHDVDATSKGTYARTALQEEGANCSFRINPISSIPRIHWSGPGGWLLGHYLGQETIRENGWNTAMSHLFVHLLAIRRGRQKSKTLDGPAVKRERRETEFTTPEEES